MHVVTLPLVAPLLALPVATRAGDRETETPVAQAALVARIQPGAFSLAQALQHAEQHNPDLRRAMAQRAALEGEAADARGLLRYNPELSLERTRRNVPQPGFSTANEREWMAGIAQTVEIAGQQGFRRQAAREELDALDASTEEARLQLRGDVERRFVQVLSLQTRPATEQRSLIAIEETALAISKQVTAGEDSRLDGNLAQVEAVRARNRVGAIQEELLQARAELATPLQLPAGDLPEAIGSLDIAPAEYTLEKLLERSATRPLLQARHHREQAATHRLSLERGALPAAIT